MRIKRVRSWGRFLSFCKFTDFSVSIQRVEKRSCLLFSFSEYTNQTRLWAAAQGAELAAASSSVQDLLGGAGQGRRLGRRPQSKASPYAPHRCAHPSPSPAVFSPPCHGEVMDFDELEEGE